MDDPTTLNDYRTDERIWKAANAMNAYLGGSRNIWPADDPVGHKTQVDVDDYLVVQFVASEDFEERPGLVGWTIWDQTHDISFGDWSFGTSEPDLLVTDVASALAQLAGYAVRYDLENAEANDNV